MRLRSELKALLLVTGLFFLFYWLPIGHSRFDRSILEALALAKWYAREHVVLCLIPAFFIAGAIACFVSQASVIKYLGPRAKKVMAYGVASVSGSVLAVCSCTVLPLFAGIYTRGAGLGPATAFLYSGPAINVLAIVLTARILGVQMGIARAVGAITFSIVIGLLMHLIFRKEERAKEEQALTMPEPEAARPLWKTASYFAAMVAVLVFANWGKPDSTVGVWNAIYSSKWIITGAASAALGVMLILWFGIRPGGVIATGVAVLGLGLAFPAYPLIAFSAGIVGLSILAGTGSAETGAWLGSTWGFAKQILPLLLGG
ncbi:MAG: permease, partial [bacterium]